MALKRVYWAAALVALLATAAQAQNAPSYNNSSGQRQSSSGVVLQRPDTGAFLGTTGSPLPITCVSGCSGGGGGGGTSALNNSTFANTSTYSNTPAGALVSTAAPTYTAGTVAPLNVTTGGALRVDGSGVTQPVSAASLPLPTGAATAAGLSTINTTLGTPFQAGGSIGNTSFGISGTLPAFAATPTVNLGTLNGAATAAAQATGNTALSTINTTLGTPFQAGGSIGNTAFGATKSGSWVLDGITGTISLPTGAATSALQSTGNTSLGTIATNTTGLATAAAQTTGNAALATLAGTVVTPNNINVICTSGCSGGGGGSGYSVVNATSYANTGTYSNVPAGGAVTTAAPTYTTGQASPLSLTTTGALRIDGSAVTQPVSGTFWQATQPVSGTVAATQSGTWNVTNISGTVSLPTGAATAANQSTANGSLATIATNSGTQATAANQSSQLTQETLINTRLGDITTPAAGTVNSRLAGITTALGSPFQAGGSIGNTAFGITGALPTGANTIGAVNINGTVPVSAASLPLPTGAATSAAQTTGNASLAAIGTVSGATSDAAATAGGTGTDAAKLRLMTSQLATIATNTGAATPAGTNSIGLVSAQGADATATARTLRTDANGGLIGGGMTPASTRSASLTTSASTALGGGGSTTRPSYLKVVTESALTANLFLCLNNQTCSATVYDEIIPSGSTVGTRLFVELPFTSAVTYFTTATAVLNVTRWSN